MITGSLQIKNDTYYAVINLKEGDKYKKKWISTKLKTKGNKRKATEFLNNILNEYTERALAPKSESIKFVDYAEKWIENRKGKIEQASWDSYYDVIERHIIPYFKPLGLDITDLKAKHIRDYYDYKSNGGRLDGKSGGLACETVKKHKLVLNAMLNYAEATDEVIIKNPAKGILPPKKINDNNNRKERVYLDPEQANKLLKLFENHYLYPLVYITLYYGFRRSEVLGLKWDAIDFENNKLTVRHTVVECSKVITKDRTKTETSTRSYKIPDKIIEMLKELKRQQEENKKLFGKEYIKSNYVFTRPDGRIIYKYPNNLTKAFQRVISKSEFKGMRFHDLRHSCASVLYDMKLGLKDIQKWLGHANISTTGNIYTHISKSREAMIADEMENALVLNF